jgi:hypothetical protein
MKGSLSKQNEFSFAFLEAREIAAKAEIPKQERINMIIFGFVILQNRCVLSYKGHISEMYLSLFYFFLLDTNNKSQLIHFDRYHFCLDFKEEQDDITEKYMEITYAKNDISCGNFIPRIHPNNLCCRA